MNGMRVVFHQPRECAMEKWDVPEHLKADEALVRTEASLVSPGTELALYSGKHTGITNREAHYQVAYPIHPGYCAVGRIERVGESVGAFKPGDRVFSLAPHASHWVTATGNLQHVPEGVEAHEAAFTQLAFISLNGVRAADLQLGESVVVTGLGLIGLLAVRFAKLAGAFPILGADLSENRRKLSQVMGTDSAWDPREEGFAAAVKAQTAGRLADVVIEASGNPQAIAQAAKLVRNGGRLVILGSPHGKVEFDFYTHIHARHVRMIGAHINSGIHPETARDPWGVQRNREYFYHLVRNGEFPLNALISDHRRPDEFPAIYEAALQPGYPGLGVVVDWTAPVPALA